jgi:hypothetical protein
MNEIKNKNCILKGGFVMAKVISRKKCQKSPEFVSGWIRIEK